MLVRCKSKDEYYFKHVGEDMAPPQRQWYFPGPHKSTRRPGFVSCCRGLVFGIHDDANRDDPGKTTSVLNTDVEKPVRHRVGIFIQCGKCSPVEPDASRQQYNVVDGPTLQNPPLVGLAEGWDVELIDACRGQGE